MLYNFCCIKTRAKTTALLSPLMLALLLAMPSTPAFSQTWQTELPQAKLIGQGEFRWFGLKIYSASLWSEHTPFDAHAQFALELTYYRHISRAQFVQTSLDEIKRISGKQFTAETLHQWEALMSQSFPDVNEGDQLIGLFIPGHGCRFYDNHKMLADISDPDFAQAFFAIWLDSHTQNNSLRERLLGQTK